MLIYTRINPHLVRFKTDDYLKFWKYFLKNIMFECKSVAYELRLFIYYHVVIYGEYNSH